MKDVNFKAAIVDYCCPICGQINKDASAIIINSKLTKKCADEVEKMSGKVVGFSEKPCKECQSYIDKGAFFIIGINSEKTDDMSNPYRSGHLVGIKKESEFYKHLDSKFKQKDAVFMDYRDMKQLGMI